MASLPELAREVGLDPLVCPHCARRVSTTEALDLLFETVLDRVRRGEVVHIRHFGSFRAVTRSARGLAKDAGDYQVIRFNAAGRAKRVIRGG